MRYTDRDAQGYEDRIFTKGPFSEESPFKKKNKQHKKSIIKNVLSSLKAVLENLFQFVCISP